MLNQVDKVEWGKSVNGASVLVRCYTYGNESMLVSWLIL
jgi:hypothetical protein